MLPDRVSNPGPLTYESGALPIALRGPAALNWELIYIEIVKTEYYQREKMKIKKSLKIMIKNINNENRK